MDEDITLEFFRIESSSSNSKVRMVFTATYVMFRTTVLGSTTRGAYLDDFVGAH